MIDARIRKRYPAFTLDVHLRAERGVTVLFGASGAGKSMTLDAIAGFARPDEGRILLNDRILFDASAQVDLPPRKRACGYVFQNHALFPHMTLGENLYFASAHLPPSQRRRRVAEALERFQLGDAAKRKPGQLSGGQNQRGSIARALVAEPEALLLDEPSRGLDSPRRRELYEVIREVRAEYDAPILLVTHDLAECLELADQVLIFRDGRIVQAGAAKAILDAPLNADIAHMLGIFNLLAVEILSLDPARNRSQLKWNGSTLEGPYFPAHLLGDRVTLCVRPTELKAITRPAALGPNQAAVTLRRVVNTAEGVRLDFDGVSVEMPQSEYAAKADNSSWAVEFRSQTLRAL